MRRAAFSRDSSRRGSFAPSSARTHREEPLHAFPVACSFGILNAYDQMGGMIKALKDMQKKDYLLEKDFEPLRELQTLDFYEGGPREVSDIEAMQFTPPRIRQLLDLFVSVLHKAITAKRTFKQPRTPGSARDTPRKGKQSLLETLRFKPHDREHMERLEGHLYRKSHHRFLPYRALAS